MDNLYVYIGYLEVHRNSIQVKFEEANWVSYTLRLAFKAVPPYVSQYSEDICSFNSEREKSHIINLSSSEFSHKIECFYPKIKDMGFLQEQIDWIQEIITNPWHFKAIEYYGKNDTFRETKHIFSFEKKSDACHFALRWL